MSDIVERLRDNYCQCLPAYKDRGMIDPHCESCQTADERTEAADEIERLRAERDAAFAMSKCQCGTEEACANLAKLRAEVAGLRESTALRVHYHAAELAEVTAERDEARQDIARLKAARIQFSEADAAEIAALREDAVSLRAERDNARADRDALRTEVDRLIKTIDDAWGEA